MAVVFNPGGRRARYGLRRRYQPITDINVTPLVDVMLVLLIVFMVTAPLLTVGVPVDLPKVQNEPINTPDEPLVVSVQKDGSVFLMQTPIEIEQLAPRLMAITANKPDTQVFLRGDQAINYGACHGGDGHALRRRVQQGGPDHGTADRTTRCHRKAQ